MIIFNNDSSQNACFLTLALKQDQSTETHLVNGVDVSVL